MNTDTTINPIEEQRAEALRHYEEVSSQCCHWSSFVEAAIKAYNPSVSEPVKERIDISQLEVHDNFRGNGNDSFWYQFCSSKYLSVYDCSKLCDQIESVLNNDTVVEDRKPVAQYRNYYLQSEVDAIRKESALHYFREGYKYMREAIGTKMPYDEASEITVVEAFKELNLSTNDTGKEWWQKLGIKFDGLTYSHPEVIGSYSDISTIMEFLASARNIPIPSKLMQGENTESPNQQSAPLPDNKMDKPVTKTMSNIDAYQLGLNDGIKFQQQQNQQQCS